MKMAYLHVIYNQRHSSNILLISVLYLLCYAEGNKKVNTCVGENAVLPCENPIMDAGMAVEWTRADLPDEYVYYQRNGEEDQDVKNPSYDNRTSLLREGNVSLKIKKVNSSDHGTYNCKIDNTQKICTVRLIVVGDCLYVYASVGENAVLPCENHIMDAGVGVEWTRADLEEEYVFNQKNGEEETDSKNPSYHDRTSVFRKELTKGNVSLKISRVKLSDEGIYKCKIEKPQKECTVLLIVSLPPGDQSKLSNVTDTEEMVGNFSGWGLLISIPLIIVFISGLVYQRQSILKLVHSRFQRPDDGDEQSPGNGVSEGSSPLHRNRPDWAAGGAGTPLLVTTCRQPFVGSGVLPSASPKKSNPQL